MRGEYCVAGASVLSALAVIMLVFTNIGQLNTGAVCNGIYMAQINVAPFGAAYVGAGQTSAAGLYDTKNDPMGTAEGLRQVYKYGIYNACGYQKDGSGVCNSTIFGYPMRGYLDPLTDIPVAMQPVANTLVGDNQFSNTGYNYGLSRAGSLCIFVGSLAALAALITGAFKARIFFFAATVCSATSAVLLMVGAAMWSGLVAADAGAVNNKIVGANFALGFEVTLGPGVYLAWVAFALMALATVPYVISCMTYRKM